MRELPRVELLGELCRALPEDSLEGDRLTADGLDDMELGRLALGLLDGELSGELERLLGDDSLDELSDERDDSLTLENDLLDP